MEYHRGERVVHLGVLPSMAADRYRQERGFSFGETEQSYDAFEAQTNRAANVLTTHGIERGERVGLLASNTVLFPATQFGIVKAGAVATPLNLSMDRETLEYVVQDAGIDTLVVGESLAAEGRALADSAGVETLFVPGVADNDAGITDYATAMTAADDTFDLVDRDPDDPCILMYTSGTTGRPKGVPLSHHTMLSSIENFSRGIPIEPDDSLLFSLPLFHIFGNGFMGLFLYCGASLRIRRELDPADTLSAIDDHDVTMFAGVPAMYTELLQYSREHSSEFDLSSLRLAVSAGAPLSDDLRQQVERAFDVRLIEGWGLTEAPAATVEPAYGPPKEAGCVGPPLPNTELKLVEPDAREDTVVEIDAIRGGEIDSDDTDAVTGEIAIRGPIVFDGYHGQVADDVFDGEGWFYTGDIGRVDSDGYLWLLDRADDVIITGGNNVYPAEVEEALSEHPAVARAAVVAAPHDVKGEAPVAFVVPEWEGTPGATELRSFTLERVAAYAHPREIFFVDELPRGSTGKVQRGQLKAEAERRLDGPLEPTEEKL